MTEDEIVGWHHRLNVHEFEQASGDGEGQGSLACCSPGGRKQSDTTDQLDSGLLSPACHSTGIVQCGPLSDCLLSLGDMHSSFLHVSF